MKKIPCPECGGPMDYRSAICMRCKRSSTGCGTYGGYQQHRKLGTPPCEPCRQAQAEYQQQWRRKTGDVTNKQRGHEYRAALMALKDRHTAEFNALLADIRNGTSQ